MFTTVQYSYLWDWGYQCMTMGKHCNSSGCIDNANEITIFTSVIWYVVYHIFVSRLCFVKLKLLLLAVEERTGEGEAGDTQISINPRYLISSQQVHYLSCGVQIKCLQGFPNSSLHCRLLHRPIRRGGEEVPSVKTTDNILLNSLWIS